ncbi:MAG: DNA mismatch repair protein MutS [Bacilli bacterium]
MKQYTPMMQQYLQIKATVPDAFLFFRLGDFYEMFFQDAVEASRLLEITLTSRDAGGEDRIPMCGVPHHSAENYMRRLVDAGYKVAICEQTEDPKQAKGVVRREVVRVLTPGTFTPEGAGEKEHHYIGSVANVGDVWALAYADLSTGELWTTHFPNAKQALLNEMANVGLRELVLPNAMLTSLGQEVTSIVSVCLSEWNETVIESVVEGLDKLSDTSQIEAVKRLVSYLENTQRSMLTHLQAVRTYQRTEHMTMDFFSKRNLELTATLRQGARKGSLLWLVDETRTSMGARLLRTFIDRPLASQVAIDARLDAVEALKSDMFLREEMREQLGQVYDIGRLAGRLAARQANPRDLVQLKRTLEVVPTMKAIMGKSDALLLRTLAERLNPCTPVTELIAESINPEAGLTVKEGNVIADGYSEELDLYRDARKNGKQWIAALEAKERERTGIRTLKIGFNKVFGYYIEVTRAQVASLPEGLYERKQTLANAERFITPELKEKEQRILEAEEQIEKLELSLFQTVRESVAQWIAELQLLADTISELDVYQSLATVSANYGWIRPEWCSERGELHIEAGRHPIVERMISAQTFVANDCMMDESSRMLLITGPNMSGKSTYMRQIALTSVLAQMGCFVPAKRAVLPVFDQIFTRIGASDDLASGQSTFMVEMMETSHALQHATQDSLILLDEIGRGTSTYDGMALAQAIMEYIGEEIGARTLFSTHYHELTVLEKTLQSLKNVHVRAAEVNGQVVFLHQIRPGAADRSYGIHVAQLAGLPKKCVSRAEALLAQFEDGGKSGTATHLVESSAIEEAVTSVYENEVAVAQDESSVAEKGDISSDLEQLSLFEETLPKTNIQPSKLSVDEKRIIDAVREVDMLAMTPMEAMNLLYTLHTSLKRKGKRK